MQKVENIQGMIFERNNVDIRKEDIQISILVKFHQVWPLASVDNWKLNFYVMNVLTIMEQHWKLLYDEVKNVTIIIILMYILTNYFNEEIFSLVTIIKDSSWDTRPEGITRLAVDWNEPRTSGNQACLYRPELWTQMDLGRDTLWTTHYHSDPWTLDGL